MRFDLPHLERGTEIKSGADAFGAAAPEAAWPATSFVPTPPSHFAGASAAAAGTAAFAES